MRMGLRSMPEIWIAGASLAIMFAFALLFSLPIVIPSGERAAFVGIHYIYPLIGIAILGLITMVAGKRDVAASFLIALPCYIAVLFAHFHLKLWIPHINGQTYDGVYWAIDNAFRPLVDACIYLREHLFGFISYESNFYMLGFIGLFYVSFLYHAIKTPDHFRTLVVSLLLLQTLGGLAYLVAPAIGPFIYEKGVDPTITDGQQSMMQFYQFSLAQGPRWIAQHGGVNFTVGLAAMPSLHAAGAFLFFLFAWRYGRVLVPLYSILLLFIIVTSVASRWHYIIDVPVGMALAWGCAWLAERIVERPHRNDSMAAPAVAAPAAA